IYTVVADINSYEAFVPWCSSSRILTSETVVATHRMTAELGVGFKAFNERYVSEVLCLPNQRVQAIASNSSLFKVLKTTWTLSPHQVPQSLAAPNSIHTNVDFHISFQFRSPIYANLSALFLEEVSQTMVGAFERRAHAIYGRSH
ncbi:cyclase/dehydrase, partial [Phlyctochytrium arcticum]